MARARRYQEALTLYLGLPALDNTDRLNLAQIYSALENFAAAAKECQTVLTSDPTNLEAERLLADVYSWEGGKQQYGKALATYAKLIKMATDKPDANLDLRDLQRRQAEITLWSGEYAVALGLFETLLATGTDESTDPKNPYPLSKGFMEAAGRVEKLTEEQRKLASRIARQRIQIDANSVEYMARVAWVDYRHLNNAEGGLDLARQAMQIKSKDPAVLSRLAWVLYQMKQVKDAETVLEEALALQPKKPGVQRELSGVLAATGNYGKARTFLEGLVKANPNDRDLQISLAQVTFASGDQAAGLTQMRKLYKENPNQTTLWTVLVDSLAAAKAVTADDLMIALQLADKEPAGESTSDKSNYLARLAWVLYHESDGAQFDAARKKAVQGKVNDLVRRAVRLGATDFQARLELANTLVAINKPEDALPIFKELKSKVLPADRQAFDARLALVTFWSKNVREGIRLIQESLAQKFDQPELQVAFVEAASASDRGAMTANQLVMLKKLANLEPKERPKAPDPALYLSRLAWALYREGNPEDEAKADKEMVDMALKLLNDAIAANPQGPAARAEVAGVLVATNQAERALPWLKELAEGPTDPKDPLKYKIQYAQALLWGKQTEKGLRTCMTSWLIMNSPTRSLAFRISGSAMWKPRRRSPKILCCRTRSIFS